MASQLLADFTSGGSGAKAKKSEETAKNRRILAIQFSDAAIHGYGMTRTTIQAASSVRCQHVDWALVKEPALCEVGSQTQSNRFKRPASLVRCLSNYKNKTGFL
jgi:hypothetical protein